MWTDPTKKPTPSAGSTRFPTPHQRLNQIADALDGTLSTLVLQIASIHQVIQQERVTEILDTMDKDDAKTYCDRLDAIIGFFQLRAEQMTEMKGELTRCLAM